MADNTLTIALEGDVFIDQLIQALATLREVVDLLSRELAPDVKIEWLIEDLQAGSAITTVAGIAEADAPVFRVVEAYERIGESLQRGVVIPYSPAIQTAAAKFPKLISRNITAIRFETATQDYVVYNPEYAPDQQDLRPRVSFGIVKGRVQTLSSRGKLKFTLYDSIFDKPVSCYLDKGEEKQMLDIWGKRVQVAGRIVRQIETGQAITVRQISSIEVLPDTEQASYKLARGIFDWKDGDEPAEITIRRLRDGED